MKTSPIRSSVSPRLASASVDSLSDLVGTLKKAVGTRLSKQFRKYLPEALIRRALDDAEEAAWASEFPHLFLPTLAEEKVQLINAALHDQEGSRSLRHAA